MAAEVQAKQLEDEKTDGCTQESAQTALEGLSRIAGGKKRCKSGESLASHPAHPVGNQRRESGEGSEREGVKDSAKDLAWGSVIHKLPDRFITSAGLNSNLGEKNMAS